MLPLSGKRYLAEWLRICTESHTNLVLNLCSKICVTLDELVNSSREASLSISKMGIIASTIEVIIRIKLENAS